MPHATGFNLGDRYLANVADPVDASHGVNKRYVVGIVAKEWKTVDTSSFSPGRLLYQIPNYDPSYEYFVCATNQNLIFDLP